MKDILITSSALILALLLLRRLFRNTVSRQFQYALWALVLLRLLIPAALPPLDFNVLSAAAPVEQAVSRRLEAATRQEVPVTDALPATVDHWVPAPEAEAGPDQTVPVSPAEAPDQTPAQTPAPGPASAAAKALAPSQVLNLIWTVGMAFMACWLLASNLRFWTKLRKARIPYPVSGCRYRVYLVESGLPSPCLFGLIRPAIYLTPAALNSPAALRHIIAHESTHARHLDPLWSLLRSLCLVVYWFDPLVWIAAQASKADCELACDEGAIRRLGEAERLAYGQTLLSLIPVRRGMGAPLLNATTMGSDKKRLKERITRIARGRKTALSALVLVIAAVTAVCAMTFTGCKTDAAEPDAPAPEGDKPSVIAGQEAESPTAEAIQTLSGAEMTYFNQTFFAPQVYELGSYHANIRVQFLTSIYERPEEINLLELFYIGIGAATDEASAAMTEEELQTVGYFTEDGIEAVPTNKLPVSDLDAVLLAYTGLTLDETEGLGLEYFTYLEDYDAYYHAHGDTNYLGGVTMRYGERDGDLIRLYYSGVWESWMCVTLQDKGNGVYWFRSNLPCEMPSMPLPLPEGEPWMTLSLDDLEPVTPAAVEISPASGDCAQRGGGYLLDNGMTVRSYLSTEGNVYAALVYDEAVGDTGMDTWEVGRFFTYPEGTDVSDCQMVPFSGLFGHSGLILKYYDYYKAEEEDVYYSTSTEICDYFFINEAGDGLVLLGHDLGTPQILDMNGDGTSELLTSRTIHLFYQKDGAIYEADVEALLRAQWPELDFLSVLEWDESYRALLCYGYAFVPEWGEGAYANFYRHLYFDGESLLVYQILPGTQDHMAEDVPQDVPEAVRTAAREKAEAAYASIKRGEGPLTDQSFDDWRICRLSLEDVYTKHGLHLEVYSYAYGFHTAEPQSVMLAGGTTLSEDGWLQGFYNVEGSCLVFQLLDDGSRVLLEGNLPGIYGVPGAYYEAVLALTLMKNGLLNPSDFSDTENLITFYCTATQYIMDLSGYDAAEWQSVLERLVQYIQENADDKTVQERFEYGLTSLREWHDFPDEGGQVVYKYLLELLNS